MRVFVTFEAINQNRHLKREKIEKYFALKLQKYEYCVFYTKSINL